MKENSIQPHIERAGLDGWLLYDYQGCNPIARRLLGGRGLMLSRRWFWWVPRSGEAVALVHQIEVGQFKEFEGRVQTYVSWQELRRLLGDILKDCHRVAMEYSPCGVLPSVSRVDAGTLEMVRACGVEIVSSAELVQIAEARWSEQGLGLHRDAARLLMEAKDSAFTYMGQALQEGRRITEYDVQRYVMDQFDLLELRSDSPPIVAVNENSAAPHYMPSAHAHRDIRPGDFVLLDLWAKRDLPEAIYADITWVAFAGATVPERHQEIFSIVRLARDRAVLYIEDAIREGRDLRGYEVDDVARGVIRDAGYADFFPHRTGHSIGVENHGNGANLDNLETRDERTLLTGTGFTVEPGIYLPGEFGIRSEINVYLGHNTSQVTTLPMQAGIVPLLHMVE
ncbi:MAG TPA: aminopeptidase P family protein [Armatimonadetes bacterium]|jgi:Xaa-Pro dipeptidase|nr:aminopeptidase P family protein [Armatimonadota bacterium]